MQYHNIQTLKNNLPKNLILEKQIVQRKLKFYNKLVLKKCNLFYNCNTIKSKPCLQYWDTISTLSKTLLEINKNLEK